MSTTIEQLGIEVQSSSTSAVSGIDALSESLRRLKAATAPVSKGGVGLGALSNSLKKFSQGVSGLTGLSLAKEQIQGLVDALKPLESVQKSGFNSLASGLDKLVKIAPQLDSVTESIKKTDLDAFAAQCNRVAAAITPLATQMQKVAAGFSAFPAKIQRLLKGNANLAQSNTTLSISYVSLAAKIGIAVASVRRIISLLSNWMSQSIEWEGIVQRFGRAFGESAASNYAWIKKLETELGINSQLFMQYASIYGSMLTGYGVAQKDAATMAMGYAELTYDIWAGFNDIYKTYEDAAVAVRSAIAGEVEPIRAAGFTIVDSQLKATAAMYGIEYSTQSATEELKSYLRYLTLVNQAYDQSLVGTYAKELNTAEGAVRRLRQQLYSLAQAFGSIFLPIISAVLPYIQAFVSLLTEAIVAVASLFGIEIQPVDFSNYFDSFDSAEVSTGGIESNLGGAAKKAKEIQNALLGIDELNIISPKDNSGGGGGGGAGGGGGNYNGLFDLEKVWDESIFNQVNQQVDEIVQKMKEWLGITDEIDTWAEFFTTPLGKILSTVGMIGASFATWKIAKNVSTFIDKLSKLGGVGTVLGNLLLLADSMSHLVDLVQDVIANGANFDNVSGIISEFAIGLGTALSALGKVKTGGALIAIGGVGNIVREIADISKTGGIDVDNILGLARSIGTIAIGIGSITNDVRAIGAGFSLVGISTALGELKRVQDEAGNIQWEQVDWTTIAIGAAETIFGIIKIAGYFKTAKITLDSGGEIAEAGKALTTTTETISTSAGQLSPKLTSMAKNLGMGIGIIAEAAAAALLVVGSIILMGMALEQVGIAWEPVIANGGTITTAILVGTGILVAIGAVAYALGTAGATIALNIGIGAGILLELGIVAALFLAEIWVIGKLLDEIGKAWEPVMANGGQIAAAIGIGTGILVAIGVVAALLGVATVATAGLLPLAILAGTALLLELGVAAVAFLGEILVIGTLLDEIGKAWEPVLNKGETITNAIVVGTGLLIGIGAVAALLGIAEVATVGLLPLAIDLGTGLLEKLAEAVVRFIESLVIVANALNYHLDPPLMALNEKLPGLTANMSDFVDFMTGFADEVVRYTGASTVAGLAGTIDTIVGWFTQDPIEKMSKDVGKISEQASDLNSKLNIAVPELKTAYELLTEYVNFVDKLGVVAGSGGAVNLSEGLKVNLKAVGEGVVIGFNDGIKGKYSKVKSTITSWGKDIQAWFTNSSNGSVNKDTWSKYASDIIDGFRNKLSASFESSRSSVVLWANSIKSWFTGVISKDSFYHIAIDVIDGFNSGINNRYQTSRAFMAKWANDTKNTFKKTIDSNSPSKVFERIGEDTVRGYNLGIEGFSHTTKNVVDKWASSFTGVNPTMRFAVDTSALRYYTNDSFTKDISVDVTNSRNISVNGFKEGMEEFYREYMEPTLNQMAEDMRRQADKEERTVVQIGNRTVNDAVTTQRKANGYAFVK